MRSKSLRGGLGPNVSSSRSLPCNTHRMK
jgi:hypothetical protein